MSRQVILVFFGDQRWDDDVHPHESSWTMTTPLCVLAVAAAVGGAINLPLVKDWLVLEHFWNPSFTTHTTFSSGNWHQDRLGSYLSSCRPHRHLRRSADLDEAPHTHGSLRTRIS